MIPLPRIIKTGVYNIGQEDEPGFIVREYVPGVTLHEALSRRPESEDIQQTLQQLGKALSAFHEIKLPAFGDINYNRMVDHQNGTWSDYVLNLFYRRMRIVDQCSPDKIVGDYSARTVQALLLGLDAVVTEDSRHLEKITDARLVHGDFHFLKVVVNGSRKLNLAAILDMENITAGDPSLDFVSNESQLNLAADRYKDLFLRNIGFFNQGYLEKSQWPSYYEELRRLYHISWSLSYFSALLMMDMNIHPITPHVRQNMDRHYQVLFRLSNGASMDSLGIEPIVRTLTNNRST